MKGDSAVLDVLNEILTAELTTINQYFVHAKMCENWGYQRLAAHYREESIGEMRDADAIMDRILYLEGVPNMQRLNPVRVGQEPVEQLRLGLELERENISRYNRAVALAREKGDNGTREILEGLLRGEEESADWLEAQLHIVGEIGKERWLAEQIRG
jgi:bacterioferritin